MSFFLLTGNGDGGSPEETVQTFLTATAEGQCAAAVEIVTDNALPDLWWGVADRQEAVEACEASSSLEPAGDDLQAMMDSIEVTAEADDKATVAVTTVFGDVATGMEFVLIRNEGDWKIDGIDVIGGGSPEVHEEGQRPEETVRAFLLADAEGDCETTVDLVTQEGWATNWEAFTREDALAACQRTSVAEPSDIPDDDLQATLNSAVLVADDGNQATVQLTIFNREDVVELEYLLVMVEGEWRIDDIRERFGDLSGPDSTLDFGREAGTPTSPPSGDPELDPLAQECYQGNMDACDMVFLRSEIGSQYEDYGLSCGGRLPEPAGSCIIAVPDPLPPG